jgi:alginate O-acetyltransferase complex protein AlgI
MLFNSPIFIFLFLPFTLTVFFTLAKYANNNSAILWLVIASLFFYGWWNPTYLLIIILSIIINYKLGNDIRESKSKAKMIFGICLNLLVLIYYKYTNFLVFNTSEFITGGFEIEEIILPLAISFFTFQQIAYLVDSWRGGVEKLKFTHYSLFVTFFPQLIAGPIVHHNEMLPQFYNVNRYKFSASDMAIGISIFSIGLFKKTVIADGIATYANPVFNLADAGNSLDFFVAWYGVLAYTLQLYFDFSGYSDMAIGLARMFGIKLPLNFYSPYKAASIVEFWRRWHITLSRFLKDYVYIPLGGNRKGPFLKYLFLFLTMFLGGLWHGAGWNFMIWGALHGFYLSVNHGWSLLTKHHTAFKLPKSLSWLLTFIVVAIGWAFFRATTFDGALTLVKSMVGLNGFALPHAIVARLGGLGEFLMNHGVTGYHGGASTLVAGWGFSILLLIAVLVLPNIQDIFQRYNVTISKIHKGSDNTSARFLNGISQLEWKPTTSWAVFTGVIFLLSVLTFGQVSDFLYFQF